MGFAGRRASLLFRSGAAVLLRSMPGWDGCGWTGRLVHWYGFQNTGDCPDLPGASTTGRCDDTVTTFDGPQVLKLSFCLPSCGDPALTTAQLCRKSGAAQRACAGKPCSASQGCAPNASALFSPGLNAQCTPDPARDATCAPGLVFCGCAFDIAAGESISCPCSCDCD